MEDVFGDPSLFSEFEKPREPSDKILMTKFKDDIQAQTNQQIYSGEKVTVDDSETGGTHVRFDNSSDSGSEQSEDSDSDISYETTDAFQEKTAQHENNANDIRVDGRQSDQTNGSLQNTHCPSSEGAKIREYQYKNAKLQSQCKLITPDKYGEFEDSPAIEVLFLNHILARKFRGDIERFIADLIERDKNDREHHRQPISLKLRPTSVCLTSDRKGITDHQERMRQINANTVIGCTHFYQDFTIDSLGWPLIEHNPNFTDGWEIPRYQQAYKNPLPCEDSDDEESVLIKPKKQNTCFNCGGDHMISECKEPKDFKKIQENKKHFLDNMTPAQSLSGKNSRYHVDDDPRFESFKPGNISKSLRDALGLKEDQLPPYIYQMRVLGYPPGYQMDAKVETSGIALFDKHGQAVSIGENPTEVEVEDGEVDEHSREEELYDHDKFIQYPGFNIDVPEGIKDESSKLGMPRLKHHQSIEAMRKQLKSKKSGHGPLKRAHSIDDGTDKTKRRKVDSSCDMDIEDNDETSASSLEDLEKQQELIRKQLALSEGNDTDVVVIDSSEGSEGKNSEKDKEAVLSTPASPDVSEKEAAKTPNPLEKVDTIPIENVSTPAAFESVSKSVDFGTPILNALPHKQDSLPDASKFARNVEEHIPYENLPNATGTYKKMRDALASVKSSLKE